MAEPYQLDIPAMTGDVAATLAQLRSLRLELCKNPRPNYAVHGESYSWQGLMDWMDRSIETCTKELIALTPYEIVSVAR
jgi:hypothetical protein